MAAVRRKDTATGTEVRAYSFVSPEEWERIFTGIERGETLAAACRVALGPSRDPSVIYSAVRADPLGLGRRLANAKAVFTGAVMAEIRRRAIEGVNEPDYFQGQVIGFTKKYSDKLLESLARLRTHKQDSQFGRFVIQGPRRGTVDGSRLFLAGREAIRAA